MAASEAMRRTNALSEPENERVREALKQIVTEAGSQAAAAERLQVSHGEADAVMLTADLAPHLIEKP